ncbi:acetoin utilization deacetylase AcuC-like enzyme [Algoriphagus boseongensis]|uniref:Acetoin utilization deacetylase AcuC-like enzyme n=1 Tax=Algoriphagus boseongensis TaxID=1442587 RepID=A0A4R6T6N6_9BACT|nr:histone deacetylase [Algoriphagus boseongensis]TDQ18818.1 acetoin utilization deacetylase AcuC-like enzyme [Algoriphagus boseongensis]
MLKISWSPLYCHPLPEGHRFPMEKYNLLPEQLIYEGTVTQENFFEPIPLEKKWITNTHQESYYQKLIDLNLSKSEIRATGFPLSSELIQREILIMGGSVQAALFAKDFGVGINIAGGTHHAFSDRGEGFCLLNDLGITANYLLENKLAKRVLIVDLDVHQGNGTAELFRENPAVFTFSMHGEKNYPHRKEVSDLDIALPDGAGDELFLSLLEKSLEEVLIQFQPDFILYQSGVDALKTDKLGRLGMSISGIQQRDKMVLTYSKQGDIPVMCCMGGGYSTRIRDVIDAHAQLYRVAQELYF